MNCIAGCKSFDGGEKLHHEDCPFYPESLSKENATLKAQRDKAVDALKKIYLITSQADPSGLIDDIWDISGKAIEHCK